MHFKNVNNLLNRPAWNCSLKISDFGKNGLHFRLPDRYIKKPYKRKEKIPDFTESYGQWNEQKKTEKYRKLILSINPEKVFNICLQQNMNNFKSKRWIDRIRLLIVQKVFVTRHKKSAENLPTEWTGIIITLYFLIY